MMVITKDVTNFVQNAEVTMAEVAGMGVRRPAVNTEMPGLDPPEAVVADEGVVVMKVHKRPFNNVDKMREGGGQKISDFVHVQGTKTVHAEGRDQKMAKFCPRT
jgi:hypothetical protein